MLGGRETKKRIVHGREGRKKKAKGSLGTKMCVRFPVFLWRNYFVFVEALPKMTVRGHDKYDFL